MVLLCSESHTQWLAWANNNNHSCALTRCIQHATVPVNIAFDDQAMNLQLTTKPELVEHMLRTGESGVVVCGDGGDW